MSLYCDSVTGEVFVLHFLADGGLFMDLILSSCTMLDVHIHKHTHTHTQTHTHTHTPTHFLFPAVCPHADSGESSLLTHRSDVAGETIASEESQAPSVPGQGAPAGSRPGKAGWGGGEAGHIRQAVGGGAECTSDCS